MLTFAEGDKGKARELYKQAEQMRQADDPNNNILRIFGNQAARFVELDPATSIK